VTVRVTGTVPQRCGALSKFTPALCHPQLGVPLGQNSSGSVRHLILKVTADHGQLSVVGHGERRCVLKLLDKHRHGRQGTVARVFAGEHCECRSRRGGVAKLQLLHHIIAQRYVPAVGKYVELLHCRRAQECP
jgi:hypothetical protein